MELQTGPKIVAQCIVSKYKYFVHWQRRSRC